MSSRSTKTRPLIVITKAKNALQRFDRVATIPFPHFTYYPYLFPLVALQLRGHGIAVGERIVLVFFVIFVIRWFLLTRLCQV